MYTPSGHYQSLPSGASGPRPRPLDNQAVAAVVRGGSHQLTTWDMITPTGKSKIAINPILHLSSLIMVRDAVRMGGGVGCLPLLLVTHDLADGTLVQWGNVAGPDIALWTLYPSRRLLSARVSAFLNYLKKVFPEGTPDELAAFMEPDHKKSKIEA